MSEPQPGVMHEIDRAFHELAIKERDFERRRVDRLVADLDAERALADRLAKALQLYTGHVSQQPLTDSHRIGALAAYRKRRGEDG